MANREPPKPKPTGQPGDDFRKIAGIGGALERRLHDAGILTYSDLAAHSPQEIAAILTDVAGISPARIASQDWVGQARKLAGALGPSLPSEPSQHYASFHVELLLDVDNSVRRTKVHHHQSHTDAAWPGWDENRLLASIREHIPLVAPLPTSNALDLASSAAEPASEPETVAPSAGPAETAAPPLSLPSSSLHIEKLGPLREGQTSDTWAPGEPTSVRLTLRVDRSATLQAATLDFTADVIARSKLGDNQRLPVGSTGGAVRVGEPLSVDLTGHPLPRGLYRLEVTVAVYQAGHTPESEPVSSVQALGSLVQVAGAPEQTAPRTVLRLHAVNRV